MRTLGKLNTLKNVSMLRPHIKCAPSIFYSASSAQPAVKEKPQPSSAEPFESLIRMIPKTAKPKKPKREPFLKNLIVGQYDAEVLTYPEIEKEELQELNKNVEPVKRYFDQLGPENTYRRLSDDLVQNMGSLRLFGLQAPQMLGGQELSITEQCRYVCFILCELLLTCFSSPLADLGVEVGR